jgi:hypothetical protein
MENIMIDFNKARIAETVNAEHFVRPVLTDSGSVKSGQRIKPGMLVECVVKKANWGNVQYERAFVGVVLSVLSAEAVKVRPLAGRIGNVATMRISDYQSFRYDVERNDVPKEMICTRRSLTILDPVPRISEGSALHTVINKFIQMCGNRHLRDFKVKLYKKLADHARNALYLSHAHLNRCAFRKLNLLEQGYRNPAMFKPQVELGAVVARGLKRIKQAMAGERELRTVTFALGSQREKTVSVWNSKNPEQRIIRTGGCAHLSLETESRRIYQRWGDSNVFCPHCTAEKMASGDFVELLDENGRANVYERRYVSVHEWDDGTLRSCEPPPVIGSYHSSKEKCGALPNLDGTAFSGLTLGMELEMEISPRADASNMGREAIARKLVKRIKDARPAAWDKNDPGYAFLENDGSISHGFEMVTSWGSLDVHREMVLKVFGPDNHDSDAHPFEGLLRSNDAECSCGLHVHLAKPESISHAAKMQAFYHDPANRKLIRAIARRYAVHYAKVVDGMNKDNVKKHAVNTMKQQSVNLRHFNTKGNYSRGDKQRIVSRAISRLSGGDRYQQVNYCNSATVEIRVFKGSMLPTTIIACLEFSQAVWMFCRDAKATDLTIAKFMEYVNAPSNRQETRFLRAYLAQRGFIVYQPRPHKDAKVYVTDLNAEEA